MKNKIIYYLFIIAILFSINLPVIGAYDVSLENEDAVRDIINEIYDRKQQYEDLAGEYDESVILRSVSSSAYWWPIGSQETVESNGKLFANGDPETTSITSPFGYRSDPFSGVNVLHTGTDISGGSGLGNVNIIAAKDGIVVYPTPDIKNDCPSSNVASTCNGGYGNYVVIQHSDGNFTLYAHMYEGSILVKAGDSVEQGQVIGKMGSSGYSTGAHLHFEVREGQNSYSAVVDAQNYISADNPRAIFSSSDFITWLNSWEGHTPIEGDYYIVQDIGDGVRTVGGGITLENNYNKLLSYGIDIKDYPVGSKISISIVDQIEAEVVNTKRTYIENVLSTNSISLEEYQIEALISMMYNTGNINGFVAAYEKYGNTNELFDGWFFRNVMKGTKFEAGLTRRRNAEWALFHTGEYVYNS